MKSFFTIAFFYFFATLLYSNEKDIKILESDERGITFQFTPEYFPIETLKVDGNIYHVISFDNALSTEKSGMQDIRAKVVNIGLPGTKNHTLSIIKADYETIHGFSLAPIPEQTSERNYIKKFQQENEFFPTTMVSFGDIGIVKGWFVGTIKIFPLQYQATTQTLKKYTNLIIRIEYGNREQTFSTENDEWAEKLLLNYSTAKNWQTKKSTFNKTNQINSAFSTGTWYKINVTEDGMYKIDANILKTLGIEPSTLNSIFDVKIFGFDGRKLPENISTSRPEDIPQLAIEYVDNNGNTKFDADDYVLFYGQGVRGWNYTAIQKQYSHYTNPYTNSNSYFIQIFNGGTTKSIATTQINATPTKIVTTTTGKIFFDEDKYKYGNAHHSGQDWLMTQFNVQTSKTFSTKLDGYVSGTPITYKYEVSSRTDVPSTFTVEESGTLLENISFNAMSPSQLNDEVSNYATAKTSTISKIINIDNENSNVKFTYNASNETAIGWLNWLEILYTQQLKAINNELTFTSPDTVGIMEYRLSNFSTNTISVFDITDITNVKKINFQNGQNVGEIFFYDTLTIGKVKKYYVGNSYKQPIPIGKISNSNIHGATGAEFIIISHNDFLNEAQRLKNHKENLPSTEKLSTTIIDIETIYNEFGFGMPDPVSIRDFLKYAATQWQIKPQYVLFFGDASYDYKRIYQNDNSWVPTYQTPESNYQINSYNYDDFFVTLTPNTDLISLAHGRLAARTKEQAKLLVDRIIYYETSLPTGFWKNTITISADDRSINGQQDGAPNDIQAEQLASQYVPKSFEVKKIYIADYPTTFASGGRRKVEARQEIINQVNNGTLLINYTGHGNPGVWAHESILTLDDVKNQFTNNDKLTFIVAATCDWGRFDEAGSQSSAEEVMINPNGGAIGVLSASRTVYSSNNFNTNVEFYKNIFPTNPFQKTLRLGDAMLNTKNALIGDTDNKRKYHLLGDPTLRLAIPQRVMIIDSINNKSVSQDTLKALEKISIVASIRNTDGTIDNTINTTSSVAVYDAEKIRTVTELLNSGPISPPLSYIQPGPILYRGENSIHNGIMKATFIIPKDISYENKNGRISLFFSTPTEDGRGYTTNVIVGGTSNTTTNDVEGPEIQIYLNSLSFRSGDVVTENPKLIVEFQDSSGINSAGNSIGHRIEGWLDENPQSIDLTSFYKGKLDSYQEGVVEYPLPNLSSGNHTFKIKAWDVYNNSSTSETFFTVASSTTLSLHDVFNIPNPTHSQTTFTFKQNQTTPIDIKINIYTIAGRLIQTLEQFSVTDNFVKIHWNGKDKDGETIGNGVYLYKVIANTIDGKFTSEATGKLSIIR